MKKQFLAATITVIVFLIVASVGIAIWQLGGDEDTVHAGVDNANLQSDNNAAIDNNENGETDDQNGADDAYVATTEYVPEVVEPQEPEAIRQLRAMINFAQNRLDLAEAPGEVVRVGRFYQAD